LSIPSAGEWHDIAIISLDTDPPLRWVHSLAEAERVALVAAVDNRGNQRETHLLVTATLRTWGSEEILLRRTQVIDELAPGEAQVVRFSGIWGVPLRARYLLTVAVQPVAGEVNTANNERSISITLSGIP